MNAMTVSPRRKPAPEPEGADTLRALIASSLAELLALLNLVRLLVDSHQRGIGFLTVEGRKVMDDQIRSERRDRSLRFDKLQAWERQWFPPAIRGAGQSPAPVGVPAVSLLGEVHDYLTDVCDRLQRRLAQELPGALLSVQDHLPRLDSVSGQPSTHDLAEYAEALLRLVDSPASLRPIHRELEELTTRAGRIVDGNDIKAHPEPCPHCGHHTLVVYLNEGVIKCERDPHTGQYGTCLCSDSYCECKTPGRYRHQWNRKDKAHKNTSWHGLRRAQAAATADRADQTRPRRPTSDATRSEAVPGLRRLREAPR